MSKKIPYTQEQLQELEHNKYTHSVTPTRLVFTLEFKQFFYNQYRNHGKTSSSILREAGYNTSYFTVSQIDKIRERILEEGDSENGFKLPRGLSSEQRMTAFEAKDFAKQKTDASIKEMQERIVHLEKQLEFLKKISFIKNQQDH